MSSVDEPSEPNNFSYESAIRIGRLDGSKMLKLVKHLELSIPYAVLNGVISAIFVSEKDDSSCWHDFCSYLTNHFFYNISGIAVRVIVEESEIDPSDVIPINISDTPSTIPGYPISFPMRQFEFQTLDPNNNTRAECVVIFDPMIKTI